MRANTSARRGPAALVLALAAAAVLSGCASTTSGQATSPLADPFRVAGLPAEDGPNGLRDNAPEPQGEVLRSDGGEIDTLALLAINDIEQYWDEHFDDAFGGTFDKVDSLLSYDSREPLSDRICGTDTYEMANAFYCLPVHGIAWDRGVLLPIGTKYFTEMGVVAVLAHEYGHALQNRGGLVDDPLTTPGVVMEQQADCLTGMYLRWVAEGNSQRFQLNTGDGLNRVLAGVIAIGDPPLGPLDHSGVTEGHGSALDRVSAVQMGFTTGADACAAMDLEEIEHRRGDLPLMMDIDDLLEPGAGQRELDADLLDSLDADMAGIFNLSEPPALSLDLAAMDCPDATVVQPATYCQATNTVAVDLDGLRSMGKVSDLSELTLQQGDYTALSVLMSRYALAAQHARGLPLDGAATALRTACLTGAAHRALAAGDASDSPLALTAGDVDETVSGVLTTGLVASDVNGATIPAGFTRIHAYRSGLIDGDIDACFDRF
jgi:predicted metalloprotease